MREWVYTHFRSDNMDRYVTGGVIKKLREEKGMTQAELAERLYLSDKTVSKWETGKGLPDISLIKPLAQALGVSVQELISGELIKNSNASCNVARSKFYVCPLCGNVIFAIGEAVVNCCGIALVPQEAEEIDSEHTVVVENVEDEHFISVHHPMTKEHFISFVAYVISDRCQLVKLYPEGEAQTRLQLRGRGTLYIYCNRHGLMKKRI